MTGVQEHLTWHQLATLARTAEAHGYTGLFRSDHYSSFRTPDDHGSLDTWALLAALSGVTERLRLGSLVSPVTFRHPSQLAKIVTTVDHASGGRVEVGIGTGWMEAEHEAFGFPLPPVDTRMALLGEQLEIIHRLFDRNEEEVTFHGDHYRVTACRALPRPVQEPHPPIILGGGAGPRSAALAARWADEYNLNRLDPESCRERRGALDRACEEAGRDPATLRTSLLTPVIVGESDREVEQRAALLLRNLGRDEDPAAFLSSLRPEWVVGSPELIAERLGEYEAAGMHRFICQTMTFDLEAMEMVAAAAAMR
jgi:F420-dependent oxidoreductase-like protein